MQIASLSAPGRGETDRLISLVAAGLEAEGYRLTGIVKVQQEMPVDAHHCDMDVRVLPGADTIRITQSLGQHSKGCRLNPEAITQAVAAVEATDQQEADLFVLNKFGPEEAEGRGFRMAIGVALEQGVPVLVGMSGGEANKAAFAEFAGEMAVAVPADEEAILAWCRAAIASRG